MSWLRDLGRRAGWRRDRREIEEDLAEEVRFHIQTYVQDRVSQGVDADEAGREAIRRFGDPAAHGRAALREDVRLERRRSVVAWLDSFRQDIHYALRGFIQRPLFMAGVTVTLVLGIGVSVAVFSVVYPVVLQPLPFRDPDRLVRVWTQYPDSISKREWDTMRQESEVFVDLAFYSGWGFTLTGEEAPTLYSGVYVSANLLPLLGIRPLVGRLPTPQDMQAGAPVVTLISERLWRTRYGSDPDILQRTLRLNGTLFRVVGVLDDRLDVLHDMDVDIIAPMTVDPSNQDYRNSYYLAVIGRLVAGEDEVSARTEMRRLAAVLTEKFDWYDSEFGQRVEAIDLRRSLVADVRTPMLVLLVAVGLVFLIVCVNVAGLMLSRATGRRREMGVRAALGADRSRLLRQMITETLMLGAIGGLLGLVVGSAAAGVLRGLLPDWVPRLDAVGLSLPVVLFAASLAVLVGVLVGWIPGVRALSRPAAHILRGAAPGSSRAGGDRWSDLVVAGEVVLAVILAVGAGLMVRSYGNLVGQNVGFRTDHALTGVVAFDTGNSEDDTLREIGLFEELLRRLRTAGSVTAVGGIHLLPIAGRGNWNFPVAPEGKAYAPDDPLPSLNVRIVLGDYFQAMGVPLLSGRLFDAHDTGTSDPVGLVNRSFAERFWPEGDAVGKKVHYYHQAGPLFTVVGVVGDVRQHAVSEPPRPEFYLPEAQFPVGWSSLVIRYRGERPEPIADLLRATTREVYPDATVSMVEPLSAVLGTSLAQQRLGATLITLFAAIALALGLIGIFGVVSFSVTRRTREFGIRLALGARGTDLVARVMLRTLSVVGLALLIGMIGAWGLSRGLQSLLYGVRLTDPAVYLLIPVVFLATAALAAVVPARRASAVDPIRTLNSE